MTNEKDREEARKIGELIPSWFWEHQFANGVLDEAADEIARIRSEAVKAEHDRIRTSLMEKIDSMKMISTAIPGPEYEFRMTRWAMDEVLTFLSDDQEASREKV